MSTADNSSSEYEYDAFISYNHADADIAKRLSRRIRRFRAPRALGLEQNRLVPFRDVERLTIAGDLTDTLIERLGVSKHLIILCSPNSAQSHYVNREIEHFASVRGTEPILPVVCAGKPEDGFPPALTAVMDEPLFVDLRSSGGLFARYRHFRAESLRIIAALLGVDYAYVAREDERRWWRIRAATTLSVTTVTLATAAMFLINSVEPQAWQQAVLPETGMDLADFTYGNPLMPIKDIAFSTDDPNAMVFVVRDAEWYGQKPNYKVAISPDDTRLDFRAVSRLAINEFQRSSSDGLLEAVYTLSFQIDDNNGWQYSTGTAELFNASLIDSDRTGYYQILTISGTDPNILERQRRYLIPTTAWTSSTDPISYWPTETLFNDGLIPQNGMIHGTFRSRLDDQSGDFQYRIESAMDQFMGAMGPERFDQLLASNVTDLEIDYDGEAIRLSDVSMEFEIWQQLLDSGDWITYTAPLINKYRITGRVQAHDDATITELSEQMNGELTLARHLTNSDIGRMEMRSVSVLSRDHEAGQFRLATLYGVEEHPIAYSINTANIRQWQLLLQRPGENDWSVLSLPTDDPALVVTDLNVLDHHGHRLLLTILGEGFYHSVDGGQVWEPFNVGENRLATDGTIKTVIVGVEPTIYALVDNDESTDGSQQNFLFRLTHRDWQTRLRIGLIEWLATP